MRRLIFVNRFFYPDHSASSQILSEVAFGLAARGHSVRVITSRLRYDEASAALSPNETVNGVSITRVSTTKFGRSGLFGRAVDYLSFYASAWRALSKCVAQGDIVIAKTDPPMLGCVVAGIVNKRQAFLINWLQDIYPEVAIAARTPLMSGPAASLLKTIRDRSLKKAAANVVIGEVMAEFLADRGIDQKKLRSIPNFPLDADGSVDTDVVPLRQWWDLEDKFVVGYSGNLGRVHDYHTILGAAESLKYHSEFVFLCIGGGKQFEALAAAVRESNLHHMFQFRAYVRREDLIPALQASDIHWVSLRPEFEGLIVPSKIYGIAAAGRAIIAIGDPGGEIPRLVTRHECGIVVQSGNSGELADQLLLLSKDREQVLAMGRRAKASIAQQYSREAALGSWLELLEEVAAPKQNPGTAAIQIAGKASL